MAIGNIVSTVLTRYKADTKQQRKEIKKLQGAEKKRHQALLEQTEKQNENLDKHIARWGKVAAGIGGVVVAAKALSHGFEVLQKDTALRAASVGVNLEGLRKSTLGLVNDTRLLEFSSKAMNGTFKLSQGQMEQALQGALALRKTMGVELPRALERMQQAVVEGSIEPLKEFGLVAKGIEGDTVDGLNKALELLGDEARSLGGDFGIVGDEISQAAVEMDNASLEMSKALGEIAIAITPVIAGFASMLTMAIAAGGAATDALAGVETGTKLQQLEKTLNKQVFGNNRSLSGSIFDRALEVISPSARHVIGGNSEPDSFDESNPVFTMGMIETEKGRLRVQKMDQAIAAVNKEAAALQRQNAQAKADRDRRAGKGDTTFTPGSDLGRSQGVMGQATNFLQGDGFVVGGLQNPNILLENASSDRALDELRSFNLETDTTLANIDALARISNDNFERHNLFAQVFGTPAEIDATAMALNSLTDGVDVFAGAFGQGVDALITGSESFGKAFKDALGQSLKAMAVDFSMQALRHGLFAVGSLAFGDLPAAGRHGAAAAAYTAGAITVGYAASRFSVNDAGASPSLSGGGGSSIAGAGAGGVGTTRPTAGGGGHTQVILFDDALASMSPREREARIRTRARSADIFIPGDVVTNG